MVPCALARLRVARFVGPPQALGLLGHHRARMRDERHLRRRGLPRTRRRVVLRLRDADRRQEIGGDPVQPPDDLAGHCGRCGLAVQRGLDVSIIEEDGGTRLAASFKGFEADVLVERPPGHESLSVVIPWSARRFQFTNKDVARPARGGVVANGRTYDLTWGTLDFGRGKWPYRVMWNWGAGAGVVDGVRVGVQLGGKWTDGTDMTENAVSVDGRLSKLSEELVWSYDRSDWLRPWTIRTPRSDRVVLTFTPIYDKRSRLKLGVASSAVDQCFGTYAGVIVPDDRRHLMIDGVFGWAEEATWRW
jgi:hypothetical protein